MNSLEDFFYTFYLKILLKLNTMDYYQIDTESKILDYVNYLFLKFCVMILLIQLIENFTYSNVTNVVVLSLVIFLNIKLIDPDFFKFKYNIKGFQTLGVRGNYTLKWLFCLYEYTQDYLFFEYFKI